TPDPRTRNSSSGRSARRGRRYWDRDADRREPDGFRIRTNDRLPSTCLLPREKLLNQRSLSRFLQEERIVSVRCVDDVRLDVAAGLAQRGGQLLGPGRRIQPVRAERDEQRAGRHGADRIDEAAAA